MLGQDVPVDIDPEARRNAWQVVKNLAGVTANDVVLCIIAGALRDYLARRHDLPDVPLVANVPVGLKASGDPSRAVELYRTVLRLVPSHYGAHYQLAVALLACGREPEARAAWRASA